MATKNTGGAKYKSFLTDVAEGKIMPVYVFLGDQVYLINEAIGLLKQKLVPESASGLNYAVYYGESASALDIVDDARTTPMFSSMKLCVLKEADKLNPEDMKLIEGYVLSPSPSTCFVLVGDEKLKLGKDVKKHCAVIEFSSKSMDIESLAVEEARKLGISITKRAAATLVSLVGEDMDVISNELRKLSAYHGAGAAITPEIVETFTEKTQFGDAFDLINAILAKNKKQALRAVLDLEARGEEPLSVLNLISWRMKLLWRAKELLNKNLSQNEIIKELKVSPGALYYIRKQEKSFSLEQLRTSIELLHEADGKLKISYVPTKHSLTKVVLELCSL